MTFCHMVKVDQYIPVYKANLNGIKAKLKPDFKESKMS